LHSKGSSLSSFCIDIYSINSRDCGKVDRKQFFGRKDYQWVSFAIFTPTSWVHEEKSYPPLLVEKVGVIPNQNLIMVIPM
jgi:hypothetical protein